MRGALFAALIAMAGAAAAETPLPFEVGGSFTLIDHHGQPRGEVDPDGRPQLLFFGYANCPGICSAAFPMMADVTADLAREGVALRPVMITVDPERDTLENMEEILTSWHPEFVGLTGDHTALDTAYKAFSVEHSLAYEDPEYGPVYTHGSFVYLLDPQGAVLTLIPPILDAPRVSGIVRGYLK
ncbi:MAG: SCO family protein [Pseudomonadota bacterium]